jgi:hypothetical protein
LNFPFLYFPWIEPAIIMPLSRRKPQTLRTPFHHTSRTDRQKSASGKARSNMPDVAYRFNPIVREFLNTGPAGTGCEIKSAGIPARIDHGRARRTMTRVVESPPLGIRCVKLF